jgi:hypothetical protein
MRGAKKDARLHTISRVEAMGHGQDEWRLKWRRNRATQIGRLLSILKRGEVDPHDG